MGYREGFGRTFVSTTKPGTTVQDESNSDVILFPLRFAQAERAVLALEAVLARHSDPRAFVLRTQLDSLRGETGNPETVFRAQEISRQANALRASAERSTK